MTVTAYWLSLSVFLWALVYAVVSDVRTLTVPNWTSILIVICYLASALVAGSPPSAVAVHLAVGMGLLVVGALLFARGVMGGGDAKILAAAGTWVGLDNLLPYLVIVAFAGGILAIAVLISNKLGNRKAGEDGKETATEREGMKAPVPYSVAIGIGAVAILFNLHEL